MNAKRPRSQNDTLPLSMGSQSIREDFIEGASTKAQRQELFLPITGFAWFYPEEIAVIDHPAFQRLGRIYQLGQAYLAFRGATHKRIEHVLGVVHIAQKMMSSVNFNIEKSDAREQPGVCTPISEREQRFIRLGALLHDIGHVSAGHTLEDELEIIGKHDADSRLDLIFEKRDWDSAPGIPVDSLECVINEHFAKYVPHSLVEQGLTAAQIVRLLIRKAPSTDQDKYVKNQSIIANSADIRFSVCANIIGNTICADLLDYLYRDWYHVGKPRTPDDRIFQYMEIRRPRTNSQMRMPTSRGPDVDDRFVIALGQKTRIRNDGVSAILGFLEWRYDLAEMVLFHRTKLAASAMLDRALYELWETKKSEEIVNLVLPLSDDQLLDEAIREADRGVKSAHEADQKNEANEAARYVASSSLLRKLKYRNLLGATPNPPSVNTQMARPASRPLFDRDKAYAVPGTRSLPDEPPRMGG